MTKANKNKLKRYIIEMCNDFQKRYFQDGKYGSVQQIIKIRNAYIHGLITERDAIKSVVSAEDVVG